MVIIAPVEPGEDLVYDASNVELRIENKVIGKGKLILSHK